MLHVRKMRSRALSLVSLLACVAGSATSARSATDVGTIVALNGRPQVQPASGKLYPARAFDSLSPGARLILKSGESVNFCHEGVGRIFRVEGEGFALIGARGVDVETGGPRVSDAGKCEASATPSETGGMLSRGLRPAASPK
jgi:hypothetical protein